MIAGTVALLSLIGLLGISWHVAGWSGLAIFVATFVVSLLVVGAIVVGLPATFLLDSHVRNLWVDHHPAVRCTGMVLKNLLGIGLIAVGLLLSLPGIPGQGLLTILIGLLLVDFPGKRTWERRIIGRRSILPRVNRLRARFGRPPLVLDENEAVR